MAIKPLHPEHKITPHDMALAHLYFPVLTTIALEGTTETYAGLIARARQRYPDERILDDAIPVSTGRILGCVAAYCKSKNLPVLSSLIVNKHKGEVGQGFNRLEGVEDAETCRKQVYSFPWYDVEADFKSETIKMVRVNTCSEKIAIKRMSDYAKAHKDKIDFAKLKDKRKEFIHRIMDGEPVDIVFKL